MEQSKTAYITIGHADHKYTATVRSISAIVDYLERHVKEGKIAIVQKVEGGWPELEKSIRKFKPLSIT